MLIVALDVMEETTLTSGHLLKASTNTRNNGCSTLLSEHGLFPWAIRKLLKVTATALGIATVTLEGSY